MIKHRIIALTGILILTAVSITGCKGIKKEKGSSSVVESVEEKATETASKEEPDVGMGNPWEEITEDEAKRGASGCSRLRMEQRIRNGLNVKHLAIRKMRQVR